MNWSRIFPIAPSDVTWRQAWYDAYASMWPQIWLTIALVTFAIVASQIGWL